MPMYSGRTADNVPQVGEIDRHEIVLFIKRCVAEDWRRVAVGEGYHILAAYSQEVNPKPWIHPDIFGVN